MASVLCHWSPSVQLRSSLAKTLESRQSKTSACLHAPQMQSIYSSFGAQNRRVVRPSPPSMVQDSSFAILCTSQRIDEACSTAPIVLWRMQLVSPWRRSHAFGVRQFIRGALWQGHALVTYVLVALPHKHQDSGHSDCLQGLLQQLGQSAFGSLVRKLDSLTSIRSMCVKRRGKRP